MRTRRLHRHLRPAILRRMAHDLFADRIRALTNVFVRDITELVRRGALEAVAELLGRELGASVPTRAKRRSHTALPIVQVIPAPPRKTARPAVAAPVAPEQIESPPTEAVAVESTGRQKPRNRRLAPSSPARAVDKHEVHPAVGQVLPLNEIRGSIPCMSIVYEIDGSHRLLVASGSLLEEQGELFWLTAGHVILEIERLRDEGRIRAARWQDGGHPPLPAQINDWSRIAVDDPQADCGIVAIPGLHAEGLRKQEHFKAFSLDDCLEITSPEASAIAHSRSSKSLFVFGYPQEWATITSKGTLDSRHAIEVSVRPVQIPLLNVARRDDVERQAGPSEGAFWRADSLFAMIPRREAVRIEEDLLNSIKGVSGGPVILVHGYRRYLIGTQTAWLPKHRVVRILPIPYIKQVLTRYFEWQKTRELPVS